MSILKTIFKIFLLLTVLLIISIFSIYKYFSNDLIDYKKLDDYKPKITSKVYSNDFNLLIEYADEKRLFVPIDQIPDIVQKAFIASEDKNYYKHIGVDIVAIFRAAMTNILNIGNNKSMIGASTITQQVVKNFLLTNEKTFSRKIKESILAFRVNEHYSKERILEIYLNEIYLGMRSYGVMSASLNYFNKSLEELNIEEIALIAGMPKAPSAFNPKRNYQRALDRRNYVIKRMLEDGYINQEQYEKAVDTEIVLYKKPKNNLYDKVDFGYFNDTVRRLLINYYDKDTLYNGGLNINTTVHKELQKYAQDALRKGIEKIDRKKGWRGAIDNIELNDNIDDNIKKLISVKKEQKLFIHHLAYVKEVNKKNVIIVTEKKEEGIITLADMKWAEKYIDPNEKGEAVKKASDVLAVGDIIKVKKSRTEKNNNYYELFQIPDINGAIVAMNPNNNNILALVGGYDYNTSKFNRAIQAYRQPGSVFKPFVYLTALMNGFAPNDLIVDAQIKFESMNQIWNPKNYSNYSYGALTLRRGLERSMNLMTIRLTQMMKSGIKKIINLSKNLGIYSKVPHNYSIVLGSAETTLLKIVSAYSSLVNGGYKVVPKIINYISDYNGKIIYKNDIINCNNCNSITYDKENKIAYPILNHQRERVIDSKYAYQTVSILKGVVDRGTGQYLQLENQTLGGKTGTTNSSFDSWFVGFSQNLVVGVYVGYDKVKSIGKEETGASIALPIVKDFLSNALKNQPNIPFKIPNGIVLMKLDAKSGKKANKYTNEAILEALTNENIKKINKKIESYDKKINKNIKLDNNIVY